ncbi:MAG: class I tRNA ligase family protein [Deltaproteobacteria bacterium]|nr:class I tRNA ligase family protein [Deltaproteobacteria bacterium]
MTVFTCGPSIYQRAHIGNFRTFLFEDVLVRYLEYGGYRVTRGMNFTDVEDKALKEASVRKVPVNVLTQGNIKEFLKESRLLRMKIPDYRPTASGSVNHAVAIIEELADRGIAYRYKGNVYFDPLQYPRFGELYGLDMSSWPKKKIRFHRDTYPGMRWNRGDFILWHGCGNEDTLCWETRIGKGRPAWNVQDPSMIIQFMDEPLSVYCGGIDNLVRHHDYTRAILESIRPYPMARYWLHCHHLFVNGQKMSKSKGNVYYVETLLEEGYGRSEIRFFLIYGHYRKKMDYSHRQMNSCVEKLRLLKKTVAAIRKVAAKATKTEYKASDQIKRIFASHMDNDLDVKTAFDAVDDYVRKIEISQLQPGDAAGILQALGEIDEVLQVIR